MGYFNQIPEIQSPESSQLLLIEPLHLHKQLSIKRRLIFDPDYPLISFKCLERIIDISWCKSVMKISQLQLTDDLLGIVFIHNHKILGNTKGPGFQPQNLSAQAVEGAGHYLAAVLRAVEADPLPHLLGGPVGKGYA